MAVPTEIRAEDVTGLKAEIKGVNANVNGLREEFAGFKGAVTTELALIRAIGKWALGAFLGCVIATVTMGMSMSWNASALSSRVGQQGERIDELKAAVNERFDKLEGGFGNLQQQFVQLDKRLDKSEAKVDARFEKLEAKMDARFDNLQQQFIQLEKRLDRSEAKADARFEQIMNRLNEMGAKKT